MATLYNFVKQIGTYGPYADAAYLIIKIEDTYTADEEYITNLQSDNVFKSVAENHYELNGTNNIIWGSHDTSVNDGRIAIYLNEDTGELKGYSDTPLNAIAFRYRGIESSAYDGDRVDGAYILFGSNTEYIVYSISTNIPIFNNESDALLYVQAGGNNIARALNYVTGSTEPEGDSFEISNPWAHGSFNNYGGGPTGPIAYRNVKGKISTGGKMAFYKVPNIVSGALKMNYIIEGTFSGLQYTVDGVTWHDTEEFPFEFFYRPRENEIGEFDFGLSFANNYFPEWNNEQDAQDYIDGNKDITEAPNWPFISGNHPEGENPTGDPDDGTDWGEVYTRSFFSQQYLCETGTIQEISNALYDISPGGLWEDIKKGLDMYGQNPMDSVISLMYYPLDLSTVYTNVSLTSSIWFGGYEFVMQSHSAKKIVYPNGFYDCGSVAILPKFRNWRDILATRIFIDLPYCGRYELDPAKYMGKNINVIYYIDTHTGGCVACLVEGSSGSRYGKCLDQYNGQMGVTCPITLTDFSAYANSQINTLLGGGGQAVSGALSVSETGAHAITTGAAAGVVGAVGGAAALGAIQGAKTVYGLSMNNINKFNQTRGGSTGMLNQYVNQKPTFIFVYPETDVPSNFNQLLGGPSNAGGTVGSFTGYFEADQIKLNMQGATQSEKEKARALLMGGVFI